MENQRIRLTKKLFHDALVECLQQEEITQISVRELCQKAGMNRSTFYLHYRDIYDLLEEIQNELIEMVKQSVSFDTADTKLYLDYIKANPQTYNAFLQNPTMVDFNQHFLETIMKEILNENILDKEIPYVNFITSFVRDGCIGVIRDWVNSGCKEDTDQLTKLLYQLCEDATKRFQKSDKL